MFPLLFGTEDQECRRRFFCLRGGDIAKVKDLCRRIHAEIIESITITKLSDKTWWQSSLRSLWHDSTTIILFSQKAIGSKLLPAICFLPAPLKTMLNVSSYVFTNSAVCVCETILSLMQLRNRIVRIFKECSKSKQVIVLSCNDQKMCPLASKGVIWLYLLNRRLLWWLGLCM